jgi:hypothetical protein
VVEKPVQRMQKRKKVHRCFVVRFNHFEQLQTHTRFPHASHKNRSRCHDPPISVPTTPLLGAGRVAFLSFEGGAHMPLYPHVCKSGRGDPSMISRAFHLLNCERGGLDCARIICIRRRLHINTD